MANISKLSISSSPAHKVPNDLREALLADERILEKWNGLTALGRGEWICWMTSVRKEETRAKHLARIQTDLMVGKRRPCCWAGCQHRTKN